MGFYEGLNEEKYDRQYKDRDLAKRIVGYFTAQRKRVAVIVVVTVFLAVISAAQPVIISKALDTLKTLPSVAASLLIGGIVLFIGVADWPSAPPSNTTCPSTTSSRPGASSRASTLTPAPWANW
jgi:ATP-binding cassette, subfamily B, bacterial